MSSDLRHELRQQKPFESPHQEAHLSIARTHAVLEDAFELMLRPYGVSAAQFNVLRILRGAPRDGLCRNEVRDRMLTRMPDVTRMLDRMEHAGWITRTRSTADRRLVTTQLTAEGRALVDSLDGPVAEEHRRRFGHLDEAQLRSLVDLLALVRQPG